jgi:streptomycin 6-kinase
VTRPRVPELDDELRRRLGRRFGPAVESWLDALPPVLSDLAERWGLELESLVRRGSISVVIRCRTAEGRPAVLKISPERRRILDEAAALGRWQTVHVPVVLAVDENAAALLIEAVEPGTPLVDCAAYPPMERLIALIGSLHRAGVPAPSYESVAERTAYLFDSGTRNYERRPELVQLIPTELYERGRRLAMRLAGEGRATVLLHGDLTPANVVDGGEERGLVAIDPAPCLGDPAFDAVDLVLWRAEDEPTVALRAEQLAAGIGAEPGRLLEWCCAFAAMIALEIAEASVDVRERVAPYLALASRAERAGLPRAPGPVAASSSMTGTVGDAVERQARAYNAHELEEFLVCYADDVIVEDAEGRVVMSGRDELRERYGRLFDAFPHQRAEIVSRMRVGSYVVDEERITGRREGDLHAIAIYHLNGDGVIDRVRLLR